MKRGLYSKMACTNLKSNYRFFIPRILAETGLLACFYIVLTLALDERISNAKGGAYLPPFMALGAGIIALLTIILMLYTNSFLMKQRKKEFGLYNVLGMELRHVGRVLFCESFICSAISIVLGTAFGILFYKLASLLVCRILKSELALGFYFIRMKSILPSVGLFVLIDLVTFFINRISLSRLKPVELLQSQAAGEREPKVKWVMLTLGVISLGAGYWLAVTTKSAAGAVNNFFLAVLLVIIGTYFLFVTGSIFVLKALKKKESYYYNKKHFTSVSGLIYRMKQNAVGLASIAILATGVLVMISCTVSLYSGMQESLETNYAYQYFMHGFYFDDKGEEHEVPHDAVAEIITEVCENYGLEVTETVEERYLMVSYYREGNTFLSKAEAPDIKNLDKVTTVIFVPQKTFNCMTGSSLNVGDGEIAMYTHRTNAKTIPIGTQLVFHGNTFTVKENGSQSINTRALINGYEYAVVVKDESVMEELNRAQKEDYGPYASDYVRQTCVRVSDPEASCEVAQPVEDAIWEEAWKYVDRELMEAGVTNRENVITEWRLDTYATAREEVLGMYGTFLFLGIVLGLVCMFATVLIVYYKQISEGYEDRNRFQIMKKVGMSSAEIRGSIRSQILWVFFLPLAVAGIHMGFAFPLLEKILVLLMLPSTWLFVKVTLISYLAFAVVYIIIYLLTAKTYYKIVQ